MSEKVNQVVMTVPFEVVILTTTSQLKQAFLNVGKRLYSKYSHDTSKPWHLHRNGYYVRFNTQREVAVLTKKSLYEGELEQEFG